MSPPERPCQGPLREKNMKTNVCVCVCVYVCVCVCVYNESFCYTAEINTAL